MSVAFMKRRRPVQSTSSDRSSAASGMGQENTPPRRAVPKDSSRRNFIASHATARDITDRKPRLEMTPGRDITYLSAPAEVSMGNRWFEIASVDHFWIRRRFEVLQRLAGDLIANAR